LPATARGGHQVERQPGTAAAEHSAAPKFRAAEGICAASTASFPMVRYAPAHFGVGASRQQSIRNHLDGARVPYVVVPKIFLALIARSNAPRSRGRRRATFNCWSALRTNGVHHATSSFGAVFRLSFWSRVGRRLWRRTRQLRLRPPQPSRVCASRMARGAGGSGTPKGNSK
jgi:hypothetical protein